MWLQNPPFPILLVWAENALRVCVDNEGHALNVSNVFEFECSVWWGQCVDGLLEGGLAAEELVRLVGLLSLEVTEALPTEELVHLALRDVGHERVEVGDECLVVLPVDEIDSAGELLL